MSRKYAQKTLIIELKYSILSAAKKTFGTTIGMAISQATDSKASVKTETPAARRKTKQRKSAPEIIDLSDDDNIPGMYLFLYKIEK